MTGIVEPAATTRRYQVTLMDVLGKRHSVTVSATNDREAVRIARATPTDQGRWLNARHIVWYYPRVLQQQVEEPGLK